MIATLMSPQTKLAFDAHVPQYRFVYGTQDRFGVQGVPDRWERLDGTPGLRRIGGVIPSFVARKF